MHAQHFFPRLLILVSILLVALAPVGVVSAAPPVVEYVAYDFNYPLEEQPCPGNQVWDHEVFTFRMTTYSENDGTVKNIKIHITDGTDNFYNPEKPSFILSGDFGGNAEVDLQTGNWINVSGITAHITLPGYGRVVMFTGHWLLYPTIHLGGLYSFDNPKDMAKFCSLLASH
jgi:hypothetical protein